MTTAREDFVAGMAASHKEREVELAQRRRKEAAGFRPDAGLEQLPRLRAEWPAEFDRITTGGLEFQVAAYEEARTNHADHYSEGAT